MTTAWQLRTEKRLRDLEEHYANEESRGDTRHSGGKTDGTEEGNLQDTRQEEGDPEENAQ